MAMQVGTGSRLLASTSLTLIHILPLHTYKCFKKIEYCSISSFENLLASIIQRVFIVISITCFGKLFIICMQPYIQSENKLHARSFHSPTHPPAPSCQNLSFHPPIISSQLSVTVFPSPTPSNTTDKASWNGRKKKYQKNQSRCLLEKNKTPLSVFLLTCLSLEKCSCIVYPRFFRPGKYKTISILVVGYFLMLTEFWNT
ncbi:LOW QUALITY PROTEIN: relaxin receptor 1 [Vipera latastei]